MRHSFPTRRSSDLNNGGDRASETVPSRRYDNLIIIPKNLGFIVPDRIRTNLRFFYSPVVNLSVNSSSILRFQPTGAFDIDPLIGGTQPPGFAQWSGFYSSYRVRSSKCSVEATNTSLTSTCRIMVAGANIDPGAAPAASYITSLVENPCNSKLSGPVGSPVCKVVNSFSTEKMYGNPMVEYDDNFASLVNTVPNNNWFWVIGFYSPAVIPAASPLLVSLVIEIEIDFYDRIILPRG